jgi:DNA transformation protein
VTPDDIQELFSAFGLISVRRMFGGAGIFAGDLMIGLVHDGTIYLKSDEQTDQAFAREGLGLFTYSRKGKPASLNYRRTPERLYDDPEELAVWARDALGVARRKQEKSPARRKGKSRPKKRR